MPALFVFMIKVNIALTLFCLGYYLVLRHLTFYTLNRVYLVIAILFSTLYSRIDVSAFLERHQEVAQPIQVVALNWQPRVETLVKPMNTYNNWYWVELVFWVGVVLLTMRFVVQLISLYKLHQKSKLVKLNDYTVRTINGNVNPFSFWRNIYINPAIHEHNDLEAILEHEQIHVNEWHTLDIILGELSTIFYWFNPGIWLIKKAIRENIEFITDRKILQKGADTKAYQYSLLHVNFGTTSNAIVNHFNISTIKKRIIMMNKKASSKFNLTRYALLLPVVLVLLLVFTVSKAELGKGLSKSGNGLIKNLNAAIKQIGISGTNAINSVAKTAGIGPVLKARSIDTITLSRGIGSLTFAGDTNKKAIKIIGSNITFSPKVNPDSIVYIVDGKVLDGVKSLNAIDPATISTVNITKSANGSLKGHAIVAITTKGSALAERVVTGYSYSTSSTNGPGIRIYADSMVTSKINKVTINGKTVSDTALVSAYSYGGPQPVYRIAAAGKNGKNDTVYISGGGRTIHSMAGSKVVIGQVIKNGTKADTVYFPVGGSASNFTATSSNRGVGNLTAVSVTGYGTRATSNISKMSDKLIIIDGKEASEKDLKKVSAADIENVSIKSGEALIKQYGDKAKNGVVFIETKKK